MTGADPTRGLSTLLGRRYPGKTATTITTSREVWDWMESLRDLLLQAVYYGGEELHMTVRLTSCLGQLGGGQADLCLQ